MHPRIELLIFDADGTLVNTLERSYKRDCQIITELGGRVPSMHEYKSTGVRGDWRKFYESFGVKDYQRALSLFYDRLDFEDIEAIPEVLETLEEIKRRDIKMAIASTNKDKSRVIRKLELTNLLQYFEAESIHSNPGSKVRAIKAECLRVKANPDFTLFVTDTARDIWYGKRAGVRTAGLINYFCFDSASSITEAKPNLLLMNIRGLLEFI
ncbi:MAG: HAD hydrolase-like protein [Nanoarchaeota archaeon]